MKFATDINIPLRMNCNNLDDLFIYDHRRFKKIFPAYKVHIARVKMETHFSSQTWVRWMTQLKRLLFRHTFSLVFPINCPRSFCLQMTDKENLNIFIAWLKYEKGRMLWRPPAGLWLSEKCVRQQRKYEHPDCSDRPISSLRKGWMNGLKLRGATSISRAF